jgi:hypothetical protein
MSADGLNSPESHEAFADAASLLEQFEVIGDRLYADWEAHMPFSRRYHHTGEKEPFTLASGATGEFRWLQSPQLNRGGIPEFRTGKRWLPSGGFNVREQVDGEQTLTRYHIGRNLSANTHQPDYAIVVEDRYLEDPERGQRLVGSTLLTAHDDKLQKCADFLTEIQAIVENKEWPSPEDEQTSSSDRDTATLLETSESPSPPTIGAGRIARLLSRGR